MLHLQQQVLPLLDEAVINRLERTLPHDLRDVELLPTLLLRVKELYVVLAALRSPKVREAVLTLVFVNTLFEAEEMERNSEEDAVRILEGALEALKELPQSFILTLTHKDDKGVTKMETIGRGNPYLWSLSGSDR